jgi:hypothetical protein
MFTKRLLELMAMAIIGDSVLCILSPTRHTGLWLGGPGWWQRTWRPFMDNPRITRALGVLGLGFGLWLAWREEEPEEAEEIAESVEPRRFTQRLAEVLQ